MRNKKTVLYSNAKEWSKFLSKIDWNLFCTFTTGYNLSLSSARRLMIRFYNRIQKSVFNKSKDVLLYWVAEQNECRDGFHLHGLLKHPKIKGYDLKVGLNNSYQIVSGAKKKKTNYRIDLDKYDKTLFGAKYLTKTQRLDSHDFDIFLGNDI